MASQGPSEPSPFSWPPSQYWDDVNGLWSSFALRVGSQEQVVRVLVSTAAQATSVVLSSGCEAPSCAPSSRGGTFNVSESDTWNGTGIYPLGLELNLGYRDTGLYGLDMVALGYGSAIGGTALDSQVVVGIETTSYYIAMFGLGPQPTNFTDFSDPHPSFLSTLKTKNLIPSLSWGYTAGAPYRLKGVYGSLTLGGYDRSRFLHNDVPFHLAPDISRDLVVVLHSILSKNSTGSVESLLPFPILAFLDSTLPFIHLPLEACRNFEQNFGLMWDPLLAMYSVDDKLHDSLIASNPSLKFTLGDSESGPTVDIVLPYASFDLLARFPFVPNDTRFFPLLRAENQSQYTLGRAFFQEAYVITNYERSNFSIFQATFEEGVDEDIVPIPARSASLTGSPTTVSMPPSSAPPSVLPPSRSRALEVGMSVGAAAILVLGCLGFIFFVRKRRVTSRLSSVAQLSAGTNDAKKQPTVATQEIDNNSLCGYKEMADSGKAELSDETLALSELPGSNPNITDTISRRRDLAENLTTNCNTTRRFATYLSAERIMNHGTEQVKPAPLNNRNTCDDIRIPSFSPQRALDVNRPLPPTPTWESIRPPWTMQSAFSSRQAGTGKETSSDIGGEALKIGTNFF